MRATGQQPLQIFYKYCCYIGMWHKMNGRSPSPHPLIFFCRWVRTRWVLLVLFWLGWVGMLAGAIVIIVQAPRCKPIPEMNWWNEGPLYQISDLEAFSEGLEGRVSQICWGEFSEQIFSVFLLWPADLLILRLMPFLAAFCTAFFFRSLSFFTKSKDCLQSALVLMWEPTLIQMGDVL